MAQPRARSDPAAILTKPPSAELRPGQMDTDSLPPYDVLDPIVEAYVERYETPEQIAAEHGFPLDLVRQTVRLIERSEYKRQQAAPVLKVTAKVVWHGPQISHCRQGAGVVHGLEVNGVKGVK
jgi:NAD+ synthase (glutamine-hydrolysing)